MKIETNVSLKERTTIGIGERVSYFLTFFSEEEFLEALSFLKEKELAYFLLGEGSNTVGPAGDLDAGILHSRATTATFFVANHSVSVTLPGSISYKESYDFTANGEILELVRYAKSKHGEVHVFVESGVNWDYFVFFCLMHFLPHFVLLSGIPGTAGALPVQNAGAYGEEIKNFIYRLEVYEILPGYAARKRIFLNEDCRFSYRNSLFKQQPSRHYIHKIHFSLKFPVSVSMEYKDVKEQCRQYTDTLSPGEETLLETIPYLSREEKEEVRRYYLLRKCIYGIRRKKGMVLEENNPYRKSAGSFFLNPVLSYGEFRKLQETLQVPVPFFRENESYKIPAAWLIEYAGFPKGKFSSGKTLQISPLHSLAIINHGAGAGELREFVKLIQEEVLAKTGIHLDVEPVFVDDHIRVFQSHRVL